MEQKERTKIEDISYLFRSLVRPFIIVLCVNLAMARQPHWNVATSTLEACDG